MKLHDAVNGLRGRLEAIYEGGEAAAIAARVLEELCGIGPSERLQKGGYLLTEEQLRSLEAATDRLLRHEPVQYIVEKSWFYGLELYVDRHVLIPRPETEELVDWIVKDVKATGLPVFERTLHQADVTTELKILDVGTGSGCIALALKKAMPLAEVWGCDSSDAALNVARRNGSALDIRADFQSVDFLHPEEQRHLPAVDILVSNPPYIPKSGRDAMAPNVVDYEPHLALFVPDEDPLLFYKALAAFGARRLHEGGSIYVEVHEDLAREVATLFQKSYAYVEIRKDMQGHERMVKAR